MGDVEGFTPIDYYGVIGDRRSAALVSPGGSIDWLCWPHFDSPSLFAAILDPDQGGYFRIGPVEKSEGRMRYAGDTNVLITEFVTDKGSLRLGDSMMRPGDRPEGDPKGHEYREVLRRVECTGGEVEVEIECAPRFDYGRVLPKITQLEDSAVFHAVDGKRLLVMRLLSPRGKLESAGDRVTARFYLNAGDIAWVSLYLEPYEGMGMDTFTIDKAKAAWEEAQSYWEGWVIRGNFPSEHRDIIVRSALVTQLLRYAETGASVAAPTTSLPEVIGGRRNYDYRYAWVRDGSLGLAVFSILGYLDEAKQAMLWLSGLGSDVEAPLQVVYTVHGDRRLEQHEIGHLRGYRDNKPVRVGNHAWKQMQPDEFGIFLDCVWIYQQQGGEMLPEFWNLIEQVADFVYDHWQDPNNGIWENIERKHFVSSLILCWAALDRAARMAKKREGWEEKEKKWRERAEEIKAYTLEYGFDKSIDSFTYTTQDKRLDASVLTAITYGMLPATDPRSRSTMRRIREQLSRGDMLIRHLLAEEADYVSKGLPAMGWMPVEKRDNPFHPCTLWLAQAYALAGDISTADSILRWTWEHAGPLGLLSEEYAPDVGEARGNYPLIFSHMELFKAVYFILGAKKQLKRKQGEALD
ncbi:MAG: glycoside hydrolase family 15 protein [Actinobacteria bacterium]|nr:glycoside hydrolase family 15 protein [Actinomycetota bacterium]